MHDRFTIMIFAAETTFSLHKVASKPTPLSCVIRYILKYNLTLMQLKWKLNQVKSNFKYTEAKTSVHFT